MARGAAQKRRSGEVGVNMTPMIDVTFQLIIFFIITGQIASTALAKLELARPHQSQAIKEEETRIPNKVIVNVLSRGGTDKDADPFDARHASCYQVGNLKIPADHQSIEALAGVLSKRKAEAIEVGEKEFLVEIRADRRVQFMDVEPVLRAAVQAEVPKMNITALLITGQ